MNNAWQVSLNWWS